MVLLGAMMLNSTSAFSIIVIARGLRKSSCSSVALRTKISRRVGIVGMVTGRPPRSNTASYSASISGKASIDALMTTRSPRWMGTEYSVSTRARRDAKFSFIKGAPPCAAINKGAIRACPRHYSTAARTRLCSGDLLPLRSSAGVRQARPADEQPQAEHDDHAAANPYHADFRAGAFQQDALHPRDDPT